MTGIRKEDNPNRSMKNLKAQDHFVSNTAHEQAAWQPEVLEGTTDFSEYPTDLDLAEVWFWLHSRLRALGKLDPDLARLVALLTWNKQTVHDALYAARLEINQTEEEGTTRQTHLEFLTAEYLAHLALEDTSIPSAGLHPA